jgi:hypothetical protein
MAVQVEMPWGLKGQTLLRVQRNGLEIGDEIYEPSVGHNLKLPKVKSKVQKKKEHPTSFLAQTIHEQSIDKLTKLKILKSSIKNLMKSIHQNAINYLTYLVLNKRRLDNNQKKCSPTLTKLDH